MNRIHGSIVLGAALSLASGCDWLDNPPEKPPGTFTGDTSAPADPGDDDDDTDEPAFCDDGFLNSGWLAYDQISGVCITGESEYGVPPNFVLTVPTQVPYVASPGGTGFDGSSLSYFL